MISCLCVGYHSPVCRYAHNHHIHPLGMGGPDTDENLVRVCPNTHTSTHALIRLTGYRYDGDTPHWIRRKFSRLSQDLALEGWTRWHDAGRPVPWESWLWQGVHTAFDVSSMIRFQEYRR